MKLFHKGGGGSDGFHTHITTCDKDWCDHHWYQIEICICESHDMIWWQKEIVICEIHIVNHMIWLPLEMIWSDGSAAPLPHCTGAAAAPAVAMSSTCRVGGGVYKNKEQRSLVLFRYIVTKWRPNSIKVVLLSENARTRGGVGSVQVLELIIMSANIILEDFIWMLKVLIIVMIHIIATSTHWVLNSRFFRWQQHQENIASQVKFFAEVSPRSNPSQLHSKISCRATQAWQTSL